MATHAPSARPAGARRISTPKAVLTVAVIGSSMAFVDASSVNIAVPNIAEHFPDAGLSQVSWVLNAYNIVFAAFLVGGGQLADLLGRRRVFCFSLFAFTFASALCAVAPSLNTLIGARVVEAAAGAVLVPSSLAIVLEAHDAHERVHAVALWSAVAALAAGIGPPLGALLITASSWRLVFLVNIPLGLLAFVLARRVLIESRAPGRRHVPDLLGGLVLALAIASLVLGVVKGPEWGWTNARVWGAFLASLLLGAYSIVRATRERTPVIDPALLRIRTFALSNGATVLVATGFFAYTLCNVLFLTSVWHYSILEAGLALTPEPFVAMLLAGPTIRLVRRMDHRPVLVLGALVWAAGMAYFSFALDTTPDFLGGWLPGMVILGIGAGLMFPTLSGVAVDSVPGPRFAVATSLNSVATQVGAALGVAILIAIAGDESFHALQHGWQFAGVCLLAGALPCLALSEHHENEPEQAEIEAFAPERRGDREAVDPEAAAQLPSLSLTDSEHAVTAPQTITEFLREIRVFAGLSPELLDRLAGIAGDVSLARGEWLFRENEEADGIYVVRVGHLEVLQEHPELQTINTLTRGAVLGELALLSESTRSASVRALRDTEVLKIDKQHFDALLDTVPELALSLTRVLSTQLQASRALPVARRARPVTIALCALGLDVPLLEIADELSHAMCAFGKVAVLHPGGDEQSASAPRSSSDAIARFGPVVERCERDHDQVLMICGPDAQSADWNRFCLSRADRVLAIVGDDSAQEHADSSDHDDDDWVTRVHGADLIGYGLRPGFGTLSRWIVRAQPVSTFAISADGDRRSDIARVARRLSGRSLGVVLGGAGARAFAHLGVLDVLLGAGMPVDRVGGVSMGAFIGGLLAMGQDSASIDACCYEEWVRRNPINDYTIPRSALVKGKKAQAMLDRVFGEARAEELSRSLYCASVDLRQGSLTISREGPLAEVVGASIALPLISPPVRRDESLLVDGSLLDNLPLAPMSGSGEGPVLAIDVKGAVEQPDPEATPGSEAAEHARHKRLPPLTDTMARIALLSSANTDESARQHADMTIRVPVVGVGLLEFHQIDQAREAGRHAARAALEDAPDWLLGAQASSADLSGQRTVLRV